MDTVMQENHMDHIIGDKRAVVLTQEHVKKARKLWEDTFFRDKGSFLDYYFGESETDRKIFAVLEEDEVLSMIHLRQQQIAIRRNDGHAQKEKRAMKMVDMEKMEAGLLTGLATRKKYRHLGVTDEVMRESLEYEYQQKCGFTYVVPETDLEKSILQEFGFAVVEEHPEYSRVVRALPLDMLRACNHGNKLYLEEDEEVSVSAVRSSELTTLAQFSNEELVREKGLFVIRNVPYYEKLWQEIKSSGGNIFICKRKERLIGYFAVTDLEGEENYREILFSEPELQHALFRAQPAPYRQVYARIVNLRSMVKHIRSEGKVTVAVRIEDPMIRENNGIFLWYLDEHGCRMERIEDLAGMKSSKAPKPEFCVSIGEFTSFIMGHLSLKDNPKFDSILKVGPVWLTEIH